MSFKLSDENSGFGVPYFGSVVSGSGHYFFFHLVRKQRWKRGVYVLSAQQSKFPIRHPIFWHIRRKR